MKNKKISRIAAAVMTLVMLFGLSVPVFADDQAIKEEDFVIKMGDEEVASAMSIAMGETVVVSVTPRSGDTADYQYDWACSDDDYLDIFPVRGTGGKEIELIGLEEVRRTKLYLTISTDNEDCEIVIDVRVKSGAASVTLSNKNKSSVSFSKNISSINLTEGSYSVEYRIFQAIYNSENKFTFNYPLTDVDAVSYVFYGDEINPIDPANFFKKVNLSANVNALSKTVRTKLEALAKSAGHKTYKFGKHYFPLYISASSFTAEATVVINLDNLNKNNKWADLVVDESLYLYYYNNSANTLTKVNSLALFRKNKKDISFTTNHGGYYIFSVEDMSKVALEDTGSSSGNSMESSAQYAIQITAQTFYGTEAAVKSRANAITAQGLLAVAEKKTSGKNIGRWALEIISQTHYGTLNAMSSKASVVLSQGAKAYVEIRK